MLGLCVRLKENITEEKGSIVLDNTTPFRVDIQPG